MDSLSAPYKKSEGVITPIEAGLLERLSIAAKLVVTGNAPVWFGPGQPLHEVTTPEERPSVEGRQWDYPTYVNTNYTPKVSEGVNFSTLRGLADNYDLLRIIIETRKDQVENLKFSIKPRDTNKDPDETCKEIQDFFAMPDLEHTWNEWIRMLMEDMLVIDAACIYPRLTRGGSLYALEPVDGSTIKRVLDESGRTPVPPLPAYQQILKGVPAINYTRDELFYKPRNLRTNRIYGYSPVEQIIMTVNIALRRQLTQLQYYTEGSTPDMLFSCPPEWNPDQVKQFQDYFNSILSGNTAERAKARFIPGGVGHVDTKARELKDSFDEWLARVVCFCFNIPPTPFTQQTNKATSETMMQQAKEDGIQPIMQWIKNMVDGCIIRYWGPDYELHWEDDEAIDPLEAANVNKIYVDAKVLHPDEVRQDLGLDPLTPQQKLDLNPPPPPGLGGEEVPDPKEEVTAKRKKSQAPSQKAQVIKATKGFKELLADFFTEWAAKVSKQLASTEKARKPSDQYLVESLPWDDWDELVEPATTYYASVAVVSANTQIDELGITDEKVMEALRANAVSYAKDRAAELVGRKWVDGKLVDNPNAEWAITDTTRERLEEVIVQSQEEGWAGSKLADAITEDPAFSPDRAEMIARTEMAYADVDATIDSWRESGVVSGKVFRASEGCCDTCQESDGEEVGLDEEFTNGDPPIHPGCECSVSAILSEED